ncbi:histidine phosphatase family protein [Streptomyces sp. BR123]|uniref:histidine phosphatase family protein n=1 Tax=Streptomyces sp. BR123 TaxID=2749828 RepID=UPI0015C438E0|nr:histidine phosphatase family protein [Streptomyces sp. BR123]NXY94809.1 histidine phosphatase family protein [Streptomyces sp. BR123]
MTVRLTLVCAAAGNTAGIFGDRPQGARAPYSATVAGAFPPPRSSTLRAPSSRCATTADEFGLKATPELALRDFDYGEWSGCQMDEIAATNPHGFSAWLTDPDATPHGGESVRQLCSRTATWLYDLLQDEEDALAITEPGVIRATILHVLSVPATAFWHIKVPPLSIVTVTSRAGRWDVHLHGITL